MSPHAFQKQEQTNRHKPIVVVGEDSYYKNEFIDMLTPFRSMSDVHLGWIDTTKHRVDLESAIIRTMLSAPYFAVQKARSFVWSEFESILALNMIEAVQTKYPSPVVFAPKKDGTVRFCVD